MSTVILIYEIVNNKYRVGSRTLCWGHNWIRVFAFLRIDRKISCSSKYSILFPKGGNLGVEVLRDPQKVSLSRVASFYLYERVKSFVFLFRLSWQLCQSSQLLASFVSSFCRVVLSLRWTAWRLTLSWLVVLPWQRHLVCHHPSWGCYAFRSVFIYAFC